MSVKEQYDQCYTSYQPNNNTFDNKGRIYININGEDRPDANCNVLSDTTNCDGYKVEQGTDTYHCKYK